ncbi:MAG: hypothetical protein AAF184_11685 [Pseudomonadota bacterium]
MEAISAGTDTRFFRLFAWTILAFVIVAFGAKALFDTKDLPPITLMHHFHAVTMGSWFVLCAVQASLIARGKGSLHRTLGRLSPLLVIAFVSFAAVISKLNWGRVGEPLIVTANSINVLMFLGFYLTAILSHRHTATHRRLMMFASLALIGPAAGRIPETLDANIFLALPISLVFIFTPLAYDGLVRKRIHRATGVGTLLLVLTTPAIVLLSESPEWIALLESMLGPQGPQGSGG